jgi:glycosyltransferase involved in cell wall biosynthesis
MNILNVNMSIDPVTGGGSSERTLQISRNLSRLGHNCAILTTNKGFSLSFSRQCIDWGLNIIALPLLWDRFYLHKPSIALIEKVIASADIINLMNHWTIINALVYRATIHQAKPFTVCPAGALQIFGRSKIVKMMYNRFIGYRIIRNAHGCIAISANEIDHFESYGVPRRKVTIIPNGVDVKDFYFSDGSAFRKRHRLGHSPIILFLGRLNHIKGPDILLEAFSRCAESEKLKPYHLVFAGPDGGMRKILNRRTNYAGLKNRVHFVGHITKHEKPDVFGAADFLAIPSRQEAMSIVVLEAGITNTPVLLTKECGFSEVESVDGGRVVEATVEGLQNGLLSMAKDRRQLEIMGESLGNYVRKNFLWDKIAQNYLTFISRLVQS